MPADRPLDGVLPRIGRQRAEAKLLDGELALLRKYGGVSPARLARSRMLVQVLGGSAEPYETLCQRLDSAVHSLRSPDAELLSAIFGLSEYTASLKTLDDRRKAYGATIGRSAATVADLEPAALDHLRAQLVTGGYPLSSVGSFVPMSHNGAVFESVSIRMVFKDRRWQETRENWRMLAAFDEAHYLNYSASHPGQPVPIGDDFTVRSQVVGDSLSHQFWHREPMRRGHFYDLRFIVKPEPGDDEVDAITETSRAFHEPTRHASFEVVFQGTKPRKLWAYERLTYFERPGTCALQASLRFSRDSVRQEYHDLYGGLFNGIAWMW